MVRVAPIWRATEGDVNEEPPEIRLVPPQAAPGASALWSFYGPRLLVQRPEGITLLDRRQGSTGTVVLRAPPHPFRVACGTFAYALFLGPLRATRRSDGSVDLEGVAILDLSTGAWLDRFVDDVACDGWLLGADPDGAPIRVHPASGRTELVATRWPGARVEAHALTGQCAWVSAGGRGGALVDVDTGRAWQEVPIPDGWDDQVTFAGGAVAPGFRGAVDMSGNYPRFIDSVGVHSSCDPSRAYRVDGPWVAAAFPPDEAPLWMRADDIVQLRPQLDVMDEERIEVLGTLALAAVP
jgi:hypothetical protein